MMKPVVLKNETNRTFDFGGETIDGEHSATPFVMEGCKHVKVAGLRLMNSSGNVASIVNCTDCNVEDVIAVNAEASANFHVFSIHECEGVRFAFCAGAGTGRKIWQVHKSTHTLIADSIGVWMGSTAPGNKMAFANYLSTDTTFLNCLALWDGLLLPQGAAEINQPVGLFGCDGMSGVVSNLRIIGCLAYGGPWDRWMYVKPSDADACWEPPPWLLHVNAHAGVEVAGFTGVSWQTEQRVAYLGLDAANPAVKSSIRDSLFIGDGALAVKEHAWNQANVERLSPDDTTAARIRGLTRWTEKGKDTGKAFWTAARRRLCRDLDDVMCAAGIPPVYAAEKVLETSL